MKSLYLYILESFDKKNITPIKLKKENKKSAICSFGTCSMDAPNVRSVDLKYTQDLLQKRYGRNVDFVCHVTRGSKDNESYKDISETNLNDYDEMWVYLSPQNAFGGTFGQEQVDLFNAISKFNGDIYGILVDPKILPTNYGEFMKSRVKHGVLKVGDGNSRDITDEALKKFTKNWNNMTIAFGGLDYNKFFNEFEEKHDKEDEEHDFKLPVDNNGNYKWFHFPLFQYYAKEEDYDNKIKDYDGKRKYDLVYFGNNRGGQRNKLLNKYYDVKGLHNFIIGFDYDEFNNCKLDCHNEYVKHDELWPLICNAYATVILGDPLHNDNYMTPRFFEALLLDVVAFISIEYDTEKKLIQNKELKDFIYVETPEELKEKVNKIKSDSKLFKHIIDLERKEVDRIYKEYIS